MILLVRKIRSNGDNNMIVLNLKLDGIYGFEDFKINFTYPKKLVNSFIENEHLSGREKFRYKKAVVLMGANATGKTSLARTLHSIFNLFEFGFTNDLLEMCTKNKSYFQIDFVNNDYILHRYEGTIDLNDLSYYFNEYASFIGVNDSYEMCVSKLQIVEDNDTYSFSHNGLNEKINYCFSYPDAKKHRNTKTIDQDSLLKTLQAVLRTLDPSIENVSISNDLKNSFIVKRKETEIVIQNGVPLNNSVLSSGTVDGIDISMLLASMMDNEPCFYYCDERFSYVHSDIEKRIFGIMLDHLGPDSQIIFTTHNTDMLDLNLPKHTYMFLRKKEENGAYNISVSSGNDILKRNTDSIRRAVENDVFSSLPDDSLLDELDMGWNND